MLYFAHRANSIVCADGRQIREKTNNICKNRCYRDQSLQRRRTYLNGKHMMAAEPQIRRYFHFVNL